MSNYFTKDSSKADVKIVSCVPVDMLQYPGMPEYTNTHFEVITCEYCEQKMYLGPKSKILLESDTKTLPLCMPCTIIHTGAKSQDLTRL